ncbi:ABC transporter permease [Ferruginibacter sp.]
MLKNFFKTTFRSLWKNKGYSFLNIAGLAIGIACAALIFLWVEDERNFDNNHVKKNNIYLVKTNAKVDAGVFTHSSTPAIMGPAFIADLPGIANSCRTTEGHDNLLLGTGEKAVYSAGNYADPSIFSMFTIPFTEGDAKTALQQPDAMVITESAAKKIFGVQNSYVGKTIVANNKETHMITGVVKDMPENSSIHFEWVMAFEPLVKKYENLQKWGNANTTTYVELKPGVDPAKIDQQLYDYIKIKEQAEVSVIHSFLFAMKDWRLYDEFDNGKMTGGGRIQYVRLFAVIAWIILFIACINFMNLATARSEKRAREVGVRKVLGSGKKRLVLQFIGEAMIMASLAAIAAVIIITLAMPLFNTLVQKDLSIGFEKPSHILLLVLLTIICGLVAGSYPSLYLSSFNPVSVLKGIRIRSGSAAFIRKGLVIVQFSVSIILIIGTIIIYQQIQHVKSRNLGFNKDNLVQMNIRGNMLKNYASIKQDILNTGIAENVALADHETITAGNNTTSVEWDGKDPNSMVVISQRLVSQEFMQVNGLKIKEGRDFVSTDTVAFTPDGTRPADLSQTFNIIITESLEKLMGKGTAVGKIIRRQMDGGALQLKVAGVVNDYVYGNMYGKADPVMFYCIPQLADLMLVRTKPSVPAEQVIAKLGAVMKADNPAYPFEYRFVDDRFNAMFVSEMLISKFSRVFALLAIIISCLGLFGLAAYTAERRTKEIGVRKVLGASVASVTGLLSKEFLKLVAIASLVAFPIAWWAMNSWLQNYQYRISISWWVFILAGTVAMLIALFTVSFQAIKAAIANPVRSLRTE